MFGMNKNQWFYLYLTLFVAIFWVGLPVYYKHQGLTNNQSDSRDEKVKSELFSEYERLYPLPGAILISSGRIIRNGSGVIAYGFSTELKDADVLAYYDKQLKDNGWTFQKDEAVKYMGFDTPERIAVYIKSEYIACIGYNYEESKRGKVRFTLSVEKPVK